MPASELVLDNTSPLLLYSGPWRAGGQDDEFHDSYSNGGTFAVTNSNEAKLSISFSGTGLTVYGAKRPNHSLYTVSLDGNTGLPLDGHSETTDIPVELYSISNQRNAQHTVVIQNASNKTDPDQSYLDIDYVILSTTTAENDREAAVPDTNPLWQYLPAGAWDAAKPANTVHDPVSDESARYSNVAGATATLSFAGTGIDLYGIVCQQCGQYAVSIDNGPDAIYNANNADHNLDYQVMYFIRGLPDETHTIKVTNRGTGGALTGIDHAVVYGPTPGAMAGPTLESHPDSNPGSGSNPTGSTPAPGATNSSSAENADGTPGNSQASDIPQHDGKRIPLAEIICGVLAILLISLGLFVFFLLRQRKRRGRRPGPVGGWRESIIPASPITPTAMASPFTLSMQGAPASFATPVSRSNSQSTSHNNYSLGLRPPTPASMRSGSASANPFEGPGVRMSVYGSGSEGTSASGLPYDQATLLQSPQRAMAAGPALVLHEAPPAYDVTSRPPSLVLDRKM